MSAAFVKILVTTRNDHVAQIMQTEPTFILGYLSTEQCWQLFEHYAFGGVEPKKDQKLVEIGKKIMNKCGLLPLAMKSIASLLRLEKKEESWKDILENELWESTEVSNEIFPSLQISYARLPTHIKPCFLYCSMFPKDYVYSVAHLVKLWMYQGFIVSKGNKTAENIGFEYALQLYQRSLFESNERYFGNMVKFKLHDIIHDLARLNSENGCHSIDVGRLPIFPNVLYHLYIAKSVNLLDPIPPDKLTTLRTLNFDASVEFFPYTFDLSMAPTLRVLEIRNYCSNIKAWLSSSKKICDFLSDVGSLKLLHYLSLAHMSFQTLPECICSVYRLQNLTLKCIRTLEKLPTKIGNLISLEVLKIDSCANLMMLPESLCELKALRKLCVISCELKVLPSDIWSLTNLETLKIEGTGMNYLPPSFSKFVRIQSLRVQVECETIGWLKDFPDWGGALCLYKLKNISNLIDAQCANLVSMSNLKELTLCWGRGRWGGYLGREGRVIELIIDSGESEDKSEDESEHNRFLDKQHCFSVMVSLQPHPNLTKLNIEGYCGNAFPEWIGSLCKLKRLEFSFCKSLQFLAGESLPLELEELKIFACHELVSISGMQRLKSLVKVAIDSCGKLFSILGPSLEMSMSARDGSHGSSSLGLPNLADEWHPLEPCKVEVSACPGLKQWCLQHGINKINLVQQRTEEQYWKNDRHTTKKLMQSEILKALEECINYNNAD